MSQPKSDTTDQQGYVDAFYELAAMLNIGAMPISPEQAWREHMRPRIERLLEQERIADDVR